MKTWSFMSADFCVSGVRKGSHRGWNKDWSCRPLAPARSNVQINNGQIVMTIIFVVYGSSQSTGSDLLYKVCWRYFFWSMCLSVSWIGRTTPFQQERLHPKNSNRKKGDYCNKTTRRHIPLGVRHTNKCFSGADVALTSHRFDQSKTKGEGKRGRLLPELVDRHLLRRRWLETFASPEVRRNDAHSRLFARQNSTMPQLEPVELSASVIVFVLSTTHDNASFCYQHHISANSGLIHPFAASATKELELNRTWTTQAEHSILWLER